MQLTHGGSVQLGAQRTIENSEQIFLCISACTQKQPSKPRKATRSTKSVRVGDDGAHRDARTEVDEQRIAEMVAEKLATRALPLLMKTLDMPQLQSHYASLANESESTKSRVHALGSAGSRRVQIEEVDSSPSSSPAERAPPKRKATHSESSQAAELHCLREQQSEIQKVRTALYSCCLCCSLWLTECRSCVSFMNYMNSTTLSTSLRKGRRRFRSTIERTDLCQTFVSFLH